MIFHGNIYEEYSFDLRQMSRETGGGVERKDFFTKALALLPRRILGYLDRMKYLFIGNGDGTSSPAACVTVHRYLQSEPSRLELTLGARTLKTFALKPNWQALEALPQGGYYEDRPRDYFEEKVSSYLEDDVLLRLVDCFDECLSMQDSNYFSPCRYLLKKAPLQRLKDYYIVSEEDYRAEPDGMPGYLQFPFTGITPGHTDSYTRFFRSASCMETDGVEAVIRDWQESEAARIWEERHRGRSFTHIVIPVTDILGGLIADIELFVLFPPASVDPRIAVVEETVIRDARHCVRELLEYQNAYEYRESALQYALSSVMTRNMSHNIGSHVYTRLTSPSGATFSAGGDDAPYRGMVEEPFTLKDEELDEYHQISYLNSYIRNRMDFISDVSYRRPSALSTWNLRSDIMKELDRTRLLLNHISGLEGNFRFGFNVVNRVAQVSPDELAGRSAAEQEELRRKALCSDIKVSIPSNTIGWHALYNIIENVIRNVAKHGNSSLRDNVFTLEVSPSSDPLLYEVLLYHNQPLDTAAAVKLVDSINRKINAPVLDGKELRAGDLGVVEMKASAAILRQMDGLCAVLPDYPANPPILEAVRLPLAASEDGTSCLWGYRFYMLRPRDFLMVVPDGTPRPGAQGTTVSELEKTLSEGGIIGHDFLVYDDSLEARVQDLLLSYRTALPMRLLTRSELSGKGLPDWKDCWIAWERKQRDTWRIRDFYNSDSGLDGKPNPSVCAVLLSHNKDENGKDIDLRGLAERWCSRPDHIYLEALSSAGQILLPRFWDYDSLTMYVGDALIRSARKIGSASVPSSKDRVRFSVFSQVMEAVNSRVFILDERIQEASFHQVYQEAPLHLLMKLSGIHVPHPKAHNLQEKALDKEKCEALITLIGDAGRKGGFVLLHYGLLERIFKKLETPAEGWLSLMNRQIEQWQSVPGAAEIIVESGRGVPKNLPSTVRFLSSSAIYSAVVEVRSKVMLDRILYTSRKVNVS